MCQKNKTKNLKFFFSKSHRNDLDPNPDLDPDPFFPVLLNYLNKQKLYYVIHTWSEKSFNGTNVNRALPSLNRGALKITFKVS